MAIKNALISVFDKSGLEDLCRSLQKHGVELYSTGGTATFLEEKFQLPVKRIEAVTQFPEMMDGRVKTLHPRVFGGILARRYYAKDLDEAARFEIPLFDLVVVNLYPFWDQRGKEVKEQASFVDIGGPSMIRAAAKNFDAVTVLSDPSDYPGFIQEFENGAGETTKSFRQRMASRTFQRTSAYDAMISSEWSEKGALPAGLSLEPQTPLRYGENPHQEAAWCGSASWRMLQGKELSYNNLLDAEAATRIVHEFQIPCLSIIKHGNPCGVAAGKEKLSALYSRALATDSKSAFGGIVATNQVVDAETAEAMSQIFLEVIICRKFEPAAAEILSKKKNLQTNGVGKPAFQRLRCEKCIGRMARAIGRQRRRPRLTSKRSPNSGSASTQG